MIIRETTTDTMHQTRAFETPNFIYSVVSNSVCSVFSSEMSSFVVDFLNKLPSPRLDFVFYLSSFFLGAKSFIRLLLALKLLFVLLALKLFIFRPFILSSP